MATDPPPPPAYTAKDGSPPPEYVHEDIVKVKLDDCHHSTADAVLTLISLSSPSKSEPKKPKCSAHKCHCTEKLGRCCDKLKQSLTKCCKKTASTTSTK
ncbi:hypothetical protein AAVH_06372 [Aphelenchoides avenae]|nr:hypothetical protein AAVH_06372 [Aphelenchus avenae]